MTPRTTDLPTNRTTNRTAGDPADLPALDGATPIIEPPRRAFVEQVMGLPMSIHVRGPLARDRRVGHAVEQAFADLRADDAMFSTWRPGSPVSRLRRGELRLADAPARVRLVAGLCAEAARRTDGAFSGWLPPTAGAAPRFDPTGLVKGWAAEQAFEQLVDRLAALGPHDALLSAGGDVVVSCTRTDTPDWTVGIEDPRGLDDPLGHGRTLLTVPLRRGAVATSGTAARGAHIVDPASGAAPSGLLSASVVGPSLTWADVYATAVFARGAAAADLAATLVGHTVVLVTAGGDVRTITGAHRPRPDQPR